ncbi:Swi3-domain-containing protein [Aspergillus campestris IBT 28561]|uniref:Chromosome segregation in meiosis protein n=1 Tax=Aspergillus campestris (strain IBT 28561) TaxID=1392248 RepID=A0A2I1CQJ9_ASPC2|nr:Swi3-domain-containing protein [Aspergillus campestris IBT 28561]PKX99899.1 Swi3-domain-containing protein [Aspergillus campestris IBT 28561]
MARSDNPGIQRGDPSPDHLGDDLFAYDDMDAILNDAPAPTNNDRAMSPAEANGSGLGLGLDEEVKISKQRQPVAKLDETRLLSQAGIPKLRLRAKRKLHFKGKGHEFSDAARLLNFYQLWLDDLYPRAKFADGLAMIEKLGHSKRLRTMRKEWIEEERPKSQSADDDDDVLAIKLPDMISEIGARLNGATSASAHPPDSTGHELQSEMQRRSEQQSPADDPVRDHFVPEEYTGMDTAGQDAPDDDELDALLREEEENMATTESAPAGSKAPQRDADEFDFMDDLDVI